MRPTLLLGALALVAAGCDARDTVEAAAVAAAPSPPPALRLDLGGGLYEPLKGDPERQALLDLVRRNVEDQLGRPVEFLVETLRVKDDWAFAILQPVRVGGGVIDMDDTRLKDSEQAFDGLRTEVIWRKTGGEWTLGQYALGATDLWYEPYCDTAPAGLIPVCAGRAPKL